MLVLIVTLSMFIIAGCGRNDKEEIVIPEQQEQQEQIEKETDSENVENKDEITEEEKSEETEVINEGVFQGDKAFDFTLTDREGNEVSLSDYEGKVVFMNFWASWCPPCKEEMPFIQSTYEKYKESNDVVILTVNITKSEDNGVEDVNKFMKDNNYSFPVLLDVEGEVSVKYRVANIPTTYIINKEGIISNYIIGPLSQDRMLEYIKAALEETEEN